jgi:hypothetical protein
MWSFYSYSPVQFASFFGSNQTDAVGQVVDAVTWDEGAWEDVDAASSLAETIAMHGIRYTGLSDEEARMLDDMIPMLFSPQGLAEQLEVEAESPDGLHPSVVKELIRVGGKSASANLLRILVAGRRFGEQIPSDCGYCFLSTAETGGLLTEVRGVLAVGGPWSSSAVPEIVESCLAGVLESATKQQRPLVGILG